MADKSDSKFKVKAPKPSKPPRVFSFTLSLPGLISAVGSGILALSFFFVMGILIGRGYRPESDVPQLGEIMPTKEHGQLAEEPRKPEILKPEELGYSDRLKADPEKVMDQPAPKPEPKPEPAAKAEPAPKAAPEPQGAEISPEAFKPADDSGEEVFNYVYQVASFRKAELAEALSGKLVNAGLRTAIASGDVNGSTWHRVQVLHHGTPASTSGMKEVLARFGIEKPLLKSKKPIR
jgi:cell division protein FtsN